MSSFGSGNDFGTYCHIWPQGTNLDKTPTKSDLAWNAFEYVVCKKVLPYNGVIILPVETFHRICISCKYVWESEQVRITYLNQCNSISNYDLCVVTGTKLPLMSHQPFIMRIYFTNPQCDYLTHLDSFNSRTHGYTNKPFSLQDRLRTNRTCVSHTPIACPVRCIATRPGTTQWHCDSSKTKPDSEILIWHYIWYRLTNFHSLHYRPDRVVHIDLDIH